MTLDKIKKKVYYNTAVESMEIRKSGEKKEKEAAARSISLKWAIAC